MGEWHRRHRIGLGPRRPGVYGDAGDASVLHGFLRSAYRNGILVCSGRILVLISALSENVRYVEIFTLGIKRSLHLRT